MLSFNCSIRYTCSNNVLTQTKQSCSQNGMCIANEITSGSKCVCKGGYTGDGITCNESKL